MSDRTGREMDILRQAKEILRGGAICDECLGRAFGKLGKGLMNWERGRALRTVLGLAGAKGVPGRCWVCDDVFDRTEYWAARAEELAAGIEYETFLFGVVRTPRLKATEALMKERFPTGSEEPLKHAFNRSVGKAFEERVGQATVAFTQPHLSFVIDLNDETITRHMDSLYVYGRYRKLSRGIPQTRWPCRKCRGTGCEVCGGTGKLYAESVEEIVGAPFIEAAQGEGVRLHGAGREDIDARMIGTGRPFVLEVLEPRIRSIDLAELHERVNRTAEGKVEVSALMFVPAATVQRIKEIQSEKRYQATVVFERPVTDDELQAALSGLLGRIDQQTPNRVSHRRADLVRVRTLHEASGRMTDPLHGVIDVRADGGMYIKELVSGDEGRTVPSLAGRLGMATTVTELDVVGILSEEFPDRESESLDFDHPLS